MVIGLNGRIPLNTAGNLAGQIGQEFPFPWATPTYHYGGGAAHAQHLGNSVSEIDPMYALQNGFNFTLDSVGRVHETGLRDSSLPPRKTAR